MKEETNHTEIKRIIRKYYEHVYANKLDNFDKVDKFLELCNLLKLTPEKK